MIGLPESYPMMDFYSLKTVQTVDGFLGANFLKAYNIWIDYPKSMVYLDRIERGKLNDMDMVGLTIQPGKEGDYKVIGIVRNGGCPCDNEFKVGDIIVRIDDMNIKGKTMGRVIDALRGNPGDKHNLVINRNGKLFKRKLQLSVFFNVLYL